MDADQHRVNERNKATIDRMAKRITAAPEVVAKALALEATRRVVMKTPVDTGRARANWSVSFGDPDRTAKEPPDRSGRSALGRARSRLQSSFVGNVVIYVTNSVPYIGRLEHGTYPNPPKGGAGKTVGGYSKQAPQGMVAVTMAELKTFAANIMKAALKRQAATGGR